MKLKTYFACAHILICSLAIAGPNVAPAHAVLTEQFTPRIVVKYRDASPSDRMKALSAKATERNRDRDRDGISEQRARLPMRRLNVMSTGAVVYHLGKEVSLAEAEAVAARIAQDPTVEYAEPDVRVKAFQATSSNDPKSSYQWPLMARAVAPGGSNFAAAWTVSKGAGVLVGVIDSGGLAHTDMASQTLNGYDFVSADTDGAFTLAGDGDGRDYDATNPGDFCLSSKEISTWHGLKVASLIVALADNGLGIAGAAPNAKVMQVRAVGSCGGFLSDIADALTWSVGLPVEGVPTNTNPVQVVNISLGAPAGTACYTYFQSAVTAAISRNVPVVVAAGNEGLNDVGAPANCVGVIAVGAHTKSGDLVKYSNRSAAVALTAPGGGACALQTTNCLTDPAVALGNTGLSTAGEETEAVYFTGTSVAAPHVAAAIALIRAVAPNLSPTEIKALLMATAKAHPAGSYCAVNRGVCGGGMLDAYAAVGGAIKPVLAISPSYATNFIAGDTAVSLTALVTAGLGSTYAWTQVSGTPVLLSGTSAATVSFMTPAVGGTVGGNLVFQAVATTALGGNLTLTQTVVVNSAPILISTKFTVISGSVLDGKLVVKDLDGDTVAFTLVDGPVGLTLQSDSLSWTASVLGDFPLTVEMTDARGAKSRGSAVVTVNPAQVTSGGGSSSSGSSSGSSTGGGSGSSSTGGGSTSPMFLGILALASGALLLKRKKH